MEWKNIHIRRSLYTKPYKYTNMNRRKKKKKPNKIEKKTQHHPLKMTEKFQMPENSQNTLVCCVKQLRINLARRRHKKKKTPKWFLHERKKKKKTETYKNPWDK